MLRLLLSSLLGLALLCGPAAAQKEPPKKDTPAKDEPKKEDVKEQVVKIKSVDPKTNTIIVTTAEGKTVVVKVNETVKILGPRGGKSEGFEDERMKAGLEITLFHTADGKTLKEIRFAVRKSTPDKDKPEKDKKDK